LTLVSGYGAAQLVNLATIPFITRLYTPDDMGVLGVFVASVFVIALAGGLKFELAMILPADQGEAHNLLLLAGLALFTTAGLTFVIAAVAGDALVSALGMPSLTPYLMLIPAGAFLAGSKTLGLSYRLRGKAFHTIATERILTVAATHGVQIAIALTIGPSIAGLIWGLLVGLAVGSLYVWCRPSLFPLQAFVADIRPADLKTLVSKYREFPLFATVNVVLVHLSRTVVLFFLSVFFNATVVGFYSLANRVLFQPLYLLSSSMQVVLLKSATDRLNTDEPIRPTLHKSTLVLAALGTVPAVVLMTLGPWLFELVFGAEWRQAGAYAQILAPLFFVLLATAPANQILVVTKRLSLNLGLTTVTVGGSVAAVAIGGGFYSSVTASLVLFATFNGVMRIVVLLIADRIAARNDRALADRSLEAGADGV
jgi:O-antigen/teichoic acid export membrane protein